VLLTWSFSACDLKEALDTDYLEACSQAACDHDYAAIGGNVDVRANLPLQITVETCRDDACDEIRVFNLPAGRALAEQDRVIVLAGKCAGSPFECADLTRWWVGWAADPRTDAGLVQNYRLIVRNGASGEVLEDHSFAPDYSFEEAHDCARVANRRDGGYINFTCAHFAATWE